jgi:hypothetical protein
LTGAHDGFPAYEIYINNKQIYGSKNDHPEKDLEDFWIEIANVSQIKYYSPCKIDLHRKYKSLRRLTVY